MASADEGLFYADGIDARTGGYLLDPLTADALAALALEVEKRGDRGGDGLVAPGGGLSFLPAEGIDRGNLAETGWGVIFPAVKVGSAEATEQGKIADALAPLFELRRKQASGQSESYFKILRGAQAYRAGETTQQYLARLGVDPSVAANPEHLPYYLLLVGSPEQIPFPVQCLLDITYAVGRIHFDRIEGYARYAESVVEAETRPARRDRTVAFFGVQNPNDGATKLSREQLVGPLSDALEKSKRLGPWSVARYYDERATKANLAGLLGGPATPALLFTAGHGIGFPRDDELQLRRQGGLVCAEWPNAKQPVTEDMYFSGDDLAGSADLKGLIAFNFACYGAGTPEFSEYRRSDGAGQDPHLASAPFVSALHKKLLSHPQGGALAAIGHIERGWSDSFATGGAGNRLVTFRSTMEVLMKGLPVGAAMEYFNQRFAQLGAAMSTNLSDLEYDENPALKRQVGLNWTAHNDARDYVVSGDPAVRLVFAAGGPSPSP